VLGAENSVLFRDFRLEITKFSPLAPSALADMYFLSLRQAHQESTRKNARLVRSVKKREDHRLVSLKWRELEQRDLRDFRLKIVKFSRLARSVLTGSYSLSWNSRVPRISPFVRALRLACFEKITFVASPYYYVITTVKCCRSQSGMSCCRVRICFECLNYCWRMFKD